MIQSRIGQLGWRSVWAGALLTALVVVGCGSRDASLPTITTKSGVKMVQIPAGYFEMGSRSGGEDERPVHKVWVDAFVMDQYEVTQAEFEKVGKTADPPFSNSSHFQGPDLPVEQVTWPLAARYCNARSRLDGLKPCYNEDDGTCDFTADGYRLPTEAEWEYACRAGTSGPYSFGDEPRRLGDFAWFVDNSDKRTHPVGQKRPNPWGLYDMHGNVAEWCQDIYDKGYYRSSPEKDPPGPADGKDYVLRGGSWRSAADALRSSSRIGEEPGFSDACLARDAIGFRCVRR
jgi:formylglycine-generating enzyme required for sulfatase activity